MRTLSCHFFFFFLFHTALANEQWVKAPHIEDSYPINQRRAYGNGCGPASILNSLQYGGNAWRSIYKTLPGHNSNTRIRSLVKQWGMKPSSHAKGKERWQPKEGISILDLADMFNEIVQGAFLPKIHPVILTLSGRETRQALLLRTHKAFVRSLKKGFPPIVSVRRYAHRMNPRVAQLTWWPLRAHFIVIISVPKNIKKGAQSFPIRYVDPYGGFVYEGAISSKDSLFKLSPFLFAHLPKTKVGKSLLKKGEETTLMLSGALFPFAHF